MTLLAHANKSARICCLLGLGVFSYAWISSAVIQLWLIPHFFSHAGAEEGLLVLDSLGFHEQAKQKAMEIIANGWTAWEHRPYGQSPVGIASAAYVLFGMSPTSLLPFNALVHALSACVVFMILRHYFPIFSSLLGALVFVLNPTSFEWVAQIHRDGIFILGNLLFILGLVCVFEDRNVIENKNTKYFLKLVIVFGSGIFLIWLGRPYWLQITTLLTSALCIALLLGQVVEKRSFVLRRALISVCVFSVLGFYQITLAGYKSYYSVQYAPCRIELDPLPENLVNRCVPEKESQSAPEKESQSAPEKEGQNRFVYQTSDWLPWYLEKHIYKIAELRANSVTLGGNTLTDAEFRIESLGAFMSYFPRALQVGLLSPLPGLWSGEGSTPAMTIARKIMGPVTLVFYFLLIGSFVGLFILRRRASMWVLCLIILSSILVFSIFNANVGTLLRYRYGFYMLLIAIGAAVWCETLMSKRIPILGSRFNLK